MSEAYEGQQYVGIDLHRRRSVLVRMTDAGDRLETTRISNDPEYLQQVMARAGEAPEVVLEATYGWYWAVDTLAELGATVHLAHPLVVKMFSYRRVKNDERDAADLADLLRMIEGRAPPTPTSATPRRPEWSPGCADERHRRNGRRTAHTIGGCVAQMSISSSTVQPWTRGRR